MSESDNPKKEEVMISFFVRKEVFETLTLLGLRHKKTVTEEVTRDVFLAKQLDDLVDSGNEIVVRTPDGKVSPLDFDFKPKITTGEDNV